MCHALGYVYTCSHERSFLSTCSLYPHCNNITQNIVPDRLVCVDCDVSDGWERDDSLSTIYIFRIPTSTNFAENPVASSPGLAFTSTTGSYINITGHSTHLDAESHPLNVPLELQEDIMRYFADRLLQLDENEIEEDNVNEEAEEGPMKCSEATIASLERTRLDSAQVAGENDETIECGICREPIESQQDIIVLPCKHWFCECVIIRLRQSQTCPQCRGQIQ